MLGDILPRDSLVMVGAGGVEEEEEEEVEGGDEDN